MIDKKNIILAFGNKEFNNSLNEIKDYLNFKLETIDDLKDYNLVKNYQGLIVHEDALNNKMLKDKIKNMTINKVIFHNSKNIKGLDNIEKLSLPAAIDQINLIISNNIVKKKI